VVVGRARWLSGAWIPLSAALIGAGLTLGATATTATVHRHSEHRLLVTQTKQAAAVISATVVSISGPLASAAQLADTTTGDPAEFRRFMSDYTGSKGLFVAASLWRPGSATPIASVGVAPKLSGNPLTSLLALATRSKTFVVARVDGNPAPRIAYAAADPKDPRYVVYAERAIPANRQVPVESDSAFVDLDFATYLGPSTRSEYLATTDVDPKRLPLHGTTATEQIPFGNSTITLVTSPTGNLGGALGARLPWICLIGGALLTIGTTLAASRLVSRRRTAERDGATIRGLYDQLDGLYAEQRTIATTLQHALLPVHTPVLPGLDVACRYVAGTAGVDVGGDWYSLVEVDDEHFAFAVGDVSGRGVPAAAVMAKLQFAMRAYLLEGHPPDVVLAMCAQQIDLTVDGHFATAVVGVCDRSTRTLRLASAGHPPPLIVTGSASTFAPVVPGVPLGVGTDAYEVATVVMPAGSTLIAFTDGLVERRSESIDDGLQRFAAAAHAPTGSTGEWLDGLLSALGHEGPEDDIAVLAFTWDGSGAVPRQPSALLTPGLTVPTADRPAGAAPP
jgi:serine phosphatase RsbU (regulator of sigma subunit)